MTNVLINLMIGKSTKKQFGTYLLSVFGFLIIMWVIAILTFPNGYNIFQNPITELGSVLPSYNGYWFFNIGCWVTGILLIPSFFYIHRKLWPTAGILTAFTSGSGVLGAISFSIVGIIRPEMGSWHNVFADVSFGSFAACGFLMFLVLCRKIILRDPWPTLKQLFYAFLPILIILVFAELAPNIAGTAFILRIDPGWFGWPFWQWISIANIWLLLFGVNFLIPAEETKTE